MGSYFKRRSHRSASGGVSPTGMLMGGAIYGVGRDTVAGFIPSSITSMVPMNLGDEVAMGILSYFMAKGTFGSKSMVKNIGKAGLAVEAYRATAMTLGNKGGSAVATNASSYWTGNQSY